MRHHYAIPNPTPKPPLSRPDAWSTGFAESWVEFLRNRFCQRWTISLRRDDRKSISLYLMADRFCLSTETGPYLGAEIPRPGGICEPPPRLRQQFADDRSRTAASSSYRVQPSLAALKVCAAAGVAPLLPACAYRTTPAFSQLPPHPTPASSCS